MKLGDYLKREGMTATEFARKCELPPSTITRLLAGDRSPRLELLRVIHRVSDGEVTPNDFLDPATRIEGQGAAA
jgi:transcriptional regulator with XRE-family HTH domain